MAKNILVKIVGEADFDKATSQIKGSFGKIGKAAAIGGAAIAAGTIAGGAALFKLGESFDAAYDTIVAGTGATGQALDELKGSFDTILASGPDSFGDVSIAVADLNTAIGLTGEPLEAMSRQFLDLSRVSGEDLSGSIKSTTRLFGDWGVAVDDQSLALDKLWTISQATGIGVSELSDQMVKSGAPLRQLGFTMEESAAIFGKWNKEGVNSEVIFSGVRTAISRMAKAGEDIPTAFGEAQEAIKNAGSASEATAIALEIFGAKAGPDMAAAIREGRFEIDDLLASMEGAEGAVARTADETASFGEKWAQFKNQLAVAFKPAALAVFGALGQVLDYIGPILTNTVIPAIQSFFYTLRTGFTEDEGTGIERVALAIRNFVIPAFAAVQSVWAAVTAAFSGGGDSGPFAAVVSAGQSLYAFFNEQLIPAALGVARVFSEIWVDIGPQVSEIFGQVIQIISAAFELLTTLFGVQLELYRTIWSNWGDEISTIVGFAWGLISGIISGALTIIQGVMETATALLKGDWSAAWDGIKTILSGVWKIIETILRAGWVLIGGLFSAGAAAIASIWRSLWNGLRAFVSGVWSSITSFVRTGGNNIVSAVAGLPRRIAGAVSGIFDPIYNQFKKVLDRVRSLWSKLDLKIPKVRIPGVGSVGGGSVSGAIRRVSGLFRASGDVLTSATPIIGGEYAGAATNPEIVSPYSLMKKALVDAVRETGGMGGGQPGVLIENMNVTDGRPIFRELDELQALLVAT